MYVCVFARARACVVATRRHEVVQQMLVMTGNSPYLLCPHGASSPARVSAHGGRDPGKPGQAGLPGSLPPCAETLARKDALAMLSHFGREITRNHILDADVISGQGVSETKRP